MSVVKKQVKPTEVKTIKVPDVIKTKVPDVIKTKVPDVIKTKVPDVKKQVKPTEVKTKVPDIIKTKVPDVIKTIKPEKATVPGSKILIIPETTTVIVQEPKKRRTLPIMNIYEKTAILAKRARDISNRCPITIKDPGTLDPYEIAKMELKAKTIPYKIVRTVANGDEEVWNVKELRIVE